MAACRRIAIETVETMSVTDALAEFIAALKRHPHTERHSAIEFATAHPADLVTREGFVGWVEGCF